MTKAAKRKPHGQTRALKNFAQKPKPVERDDLARAREQAEAQFNSIAEMVEALGGHEAAATAAKWTGPHKDKFGAQYYQQIDEGERVTYCAKDWKELCEAFGIEPDG